VEQENMGQGQDLEGVLVERFHVQTGFYPEQRKLFERLLQGERLLVIQPGSWRALLCSQVASVYLPHLTLIFSPLKVLLRDQCQLNNSLYGIPSAFVSSDKSFQENCATFTRAMAGTIKILFLATEQLDSAEWERYLLKLKISLLVVEQVHYVSGESHDVRQHYQRFVGMMNDLAPRVPLLLLTDATNKRVEMDILRQFCTVNVIRSSFDPSNLSLHVVRLHGDWEKLCYLATVLFQRSDAGIIYTGTLESAIMITLFLCSYDIKAVYERTGYDEEKRLDAECNRGISSYRVLCRVPEQDEDTSSIRFVIHYHAPDSLINYYREICGSLQLDRRLRCVLLYDPTDVVQQERFIEQDELQEQHYREVLSLLQAHSQGTHENNLLINTGLSASRLQTILDHLLEQGLISLNKGTKRYRPTSRVLSRKSDARIHEESDVDFSLYEQIRRRKLNELVALQHYTRTAHCYTAHLSNYLEDVIPAYDCCELCSNCSKQQFPDVHPTQTIQMAVTQFLEHDFLPCIEQQGTEEGRAHEAGWALAYHDGSRIGRQVHACKYYGAGPFPLSLVLRAAEIAKTRYPIQHLQAVVGIPSSESSSLIEQFARQIASRLGKEYFAGLVKIRPTSSQKQLSYRSHKVNNVRGAFAVREPEKLVQCSLLLIDDIYDSGCTLYEAGKTLIEAGAEAVYPLTITRTLSANLEQGGRV
jgi:ATP-dependent DNA helicase RecQ